MKLERKHKRGITLGIAVLLILYGLLSSVFHFNFDPKTVNTVTTILMAVALWMIFSLRKNDSPDQTEGNRDLQDSSGDSGDTGSLLEADNSAESHTEHDNNDSSQMDDGSNND